MMIDRKDQELRHTDRGQDMEGSMMNLFRETIEPLELGKKITF